MPITVPAYIQEWEIHGELMTVKPMPQTSPERRPATAVAKIVPTESRYKKGRRKPTTNSPRMMLAARHIPVSGQFVQPATFLKRENSAQSRLILHLLL